MHTDTFTHTPKAWVLEDPISQYNHHQKLRLLRAQETLEKGFKTSGFSPSGLIFEIPLLLLFPGFPGMYSLPSYLGNRAETSLSFLLLSEVAWVGEMNTPRLMAGNRHSIPWGSGTVSLSAGAGWSHVSVWRWEATLQAVLRCNHPPWWV